VDELMHLLAQLGLGTTAQPIYAMIMDLDADAMTPPQLEQAIRGILLLHGCGACADAVVAALAEVKFTGLN
jgi:hypothetical protein